MRSVFDVRSKIFQDFLKRNLHHIIPLMLTASAFYNQIVGNVSTDGIDYTSPQGQLSIAVTIWVAFQAYFMTKTSSLTKDFYAYMIDKYREKDKPAPSIEYAKLALRGLPMNKLDLEIGRFLEGQNVTIRMFI
jgi:hypothetical protein